MPNGRCRMHGGKSALGPAAGNYKTGRYSKYLPTRLAERYQEAQADPDLLDLRHEIALLDARLSDILGRVDTGESGTVWVRLQAALADFKKARGGAGLQDAAEAFGRIQELIQHGAADHEIWAEVRSHLDQRRKLVDSERKRLVEMQQMITSERAMILLAVVVDTIRKHVTDRGVLAAIAADIGALVAVDPQRPHPGVGDGTTARRA